MEPDSNEGLLPEAWVSGPGGIAQSIRLPGGRDFTACTWTWRDPTASLVPLYYQEVQQPAHLDSELAGFFEQFILTNGTVAARGQFYDNAAGVRLRDALLGGRKMGVSVDPTERWEYEEVCTETDEYGACIAADLKILAYEIGGATCTPLQAFDTAAIMLDTPDAVAASGADISTGELLERAANGTEVIGLRGPRTLTPIYAAATPVAPPAAWFAMPEPEIGDDLLVDQGDGSFACPLTISDDGQVYGHLARWGQCHVGYQGECVSPPASLAAYTHFHVGAVRTAEGDTLATGALTVGCDHAPLGVSLWEAQDHYAHSGSGWADVRASNGEMGVWVTGALRPGVTDDQLRVLRALALSGDWRKAGDGLELVAGLAVNTPGFPIAREALAASALTVAEVTLAQRYAHGQTVSLVAAGRVTRCPECAQRARLAQSSGRFDGGMAEVLAGMAEMRAAVATLERRTRPLQQAAVDAARARVAT